MIDKFESIDIIKNHFPHGTIERGPVKYNGGYLFSIFHDGVEGSLDTLYLVKYNGSVVGVSFMSDMRGIMAALSSEVSDYD